MAQSPLTLLTISSSSFTGSATGTVDLGGLHRRLQVSYYGSSDASFISDLQLVVDKRDNPAIPQLVYDTVGGLIYETRLVNFGFSPSNIGVYAPVKESFFRYVTATITGSSSSFTAGTAKVLLNFDGPQWP